MPNEEGANYYEVRRQASVVMSQSAAHPGIVKIHLELARRYALLANVIGPMTVAPRFIAAKKEIARDRGNIS